MKEHRAGEHVLHPNCLDWGVGRVLRARPDGVVTVDFRRGGIRVLHMGKVSFELQRVEGQAPPPAPVSHGDADEALYAGLAADQRAAVEAVVRRKERLVLISGAAGTGKSHVIHRITDAQTLVVAPTGLAACNVNGTTIHRAFGIPIGVVQASALRAVRSDEAAVLKRIERLVLDEVSMARADIIDALDHRLRTVRRCEAPFGGVQVVLVGDPYQLPPVVTVKDQPLLEHLGYRTAYFFSARVLKENPPRHYELRVQHRQKDDADFLEILNRVRGGCHTSGDLVSLNQRVLGTPQSAVILSARNGQVDRINAGKLAALPGPGEVFHATENNWRDREKPADEALVLRKRARVVLLRNDPSGQWVNGSQGTVMSWTSDAVKVKLDGAGVVSVERSRWELEEPYIDEETEEIRYRTVGSFVQFPLRLGWALTIHRSQGMTLQSVAIDLGRGSFARGQTYVALSRVRRVEDMVLENPLKDSDIRADGVVQAYFAWLDRQDRAATGEGFPS